MTEFLLSLDEIERVKRQRRIPRTVDLAEVTGLARNTWTKALSTRKPTPMVLDALASLGARPDKILVLEDMPDRKANKTVSKTVSA